MEDVNVVTQDGNGLSKEEIAQALSRTLDGRKLKRVLIIPPDFTRYHSNAGLMTNILWHRLRDNGVAVDVMPALGTHVPVSERQWETMFGDIPYSEMIIHDWRNDVVKIGEIPQDEVERITEGLWHHPVPVEVNKRFIDKSYDLVVSPGQVVPHEVVGMANHGKNIFVGIGGSAMINASHMIGAVCGMEKAMGRDHSPVRKLFDYALEHFVYGKIPVLFALTVTTAPDGKIVQHGLFIGEGRKCLENAVALAQKMNTDKVERPIRKCIVYLEPSEFTSTWLGNKAIYRTRMAMADGGELIVLAPGVERFGEDLTVDALIRKYGYKGRLATLAAFEAPENSDLRANAGAAAHLIHGSSDGRFSITYAVAKITQDEIEGVGFKYASYSEMAKKYNPQSLKAGWNQVDGEEIFYIPNPALGLWTADR